MDVGLLIARSVFGLLLAAHGCQKLFGWFRGPGLGRTATFFEALGFHPGRLFVVVGLIGWWTPQVAVIAIGTGVLGAVVSLGLRRMSAAVAHA